MMREYRVTFGQKYRREKHPTLPEAHPDGWAAVWAVDELEARQVAVNRLGRAWAFLYRPGELEEAWFPAGELVTLNPENKP